MSRVNGKETVTGVLSWSIFSDVVQLISVLLCLRIS